MKQGKVKELGKFTMGLDTEPRDKIIDMVKGAVGKSAAEKIFNVTIREEIERRADFEITKKAMPDGSTKFVKKPRKAIEIGKGKMEANQKQDGPPWDGPSKTVKGPTDFHAMRAKVKSLAIKGMNQAGKKPGVKKNG